MDKTASIRRANQVIAQRVQEKTFRDSSVSDHSDGILWEMVVAALEENLQTRHYMGHIDRSRSAAFGLMAARELKLRGTQLTLC
jgi:hypothetical protein